ncbi:MAG: hypothetical protein AB7G62_00020 [Magnetospirillum sp.]
MTVSGDAKPHKAFGLLAVAGSVACSVGTLVAGFGHSWGQVVAAGGFVLFAAIEQPRLNRTARVYCLIALAALVLSVIRRGEIGPGLIHALADGALFAAIFASVGLLAAASRHSTLVQRCGQALIRQPPSRRYAALTAGGHLLSILLSFGALPLLATMIGQANSLHEAGGDERIQRVRSQRMLLALLRSFCAILLWSPLSVAVLMVLGTIPGLGWRDIGVFGIIEAAILLALGALVDRASFARRTVPTAGDTAIPWRDALILAGIAASVFATASLIHHGAQVPLTIGIIAGVPLVALGWLMAQVRPSAWIDHGLMVIGPYLRHGLTAQRTEVAVVGAAAAIGAVMLDLLPAHAIDGAASHLALPPWLAVGVIVWVIVGLGQVGLNPVLTVAMLAPGLAQGFPDIHRPVLALALVTGWSISLQSSPFTAGILMLSQYAQVPPATFGRVWNGRYVLAALCVASLFLGVLQMAWG